MTDITLTRQSGALSETELATLRSLLFRLVDGLTERDRKRWRNWWGRWKRSEPGEITSVKSAFHRSGPFHRRHMAIESAVFDAQERLADFEQFRLWLKLGAGFVDWMPGPKGGVVPVPKSISYAECDDLTMGEFHRSAIEFLRGPHAAPYLWRGVSSELAHEAMNAVLTEFEE